MVTRIGINGFGRVGRLALRALNERHKGDLEVVAINGHEDTTLDAHLLKWDSSYGRFPGKIEVADNCICIDGVNIPVLAERDPSKIPWSDYGVEVVLECTGAFTNGHKAADHLGGSVKKVIISAAASNSDVTLVMGVNEKDYIPEKHQVISNASCTTNCIAPVVKALHENFGILSGMMTTVHAYTNDQRLLDKSHSDLRRARAAADSMIPTKTGATKMIGVVFPELAGKITGMSVRVPTQTVSLVDFVAILDKEVTREEVNRAFREASLLRPDILEYCEEELVSVDFKGNPASSIIDAKSTMVTGNMVKVLSWYDNEWGYSCRLGDLVAYVAEKGLADADEPVGDLEFSVA